MLWNVKSPMISPKERFCCVLQIIKTHRFPPQKGSDVLRTIKTSTPKEEAAHRPSKAFPHPFSTGPDGMTPWGVLGGCPASSWGWTLMSFLGVLTSFWGYSIILGGVLTSFSEVPQILQHLHSMHCQRYVLTAAIITGVNCRQEGCPGKQAGHK